MVRITIISGYGFTFDIQAIHTWLDKVLTNFPLKTY